MTRIRLLSMAVLLLILLSAVLPAAASSSAVYLKVIRYDGVDNVLYAPCYASYGIEVMGADEDDEITYRWQVNVAGIVGSHEWLEASDCTWTWNYFTPVISIRINEGYHTATPPNRFCLRCIVKVEGTEYLSPVFEIIAQERHTYDSINVKLSSEPSVGQKPNQSFSFTTEHLTSAGMTWYAVQVDGSYRKMGTTETFVSGASYACEFRAGMEESWFIDVGTTGAMVNGAPARLQLEPGDDRAIRVYQVYYMDGTKAVPVGYSKDLASLLQFRYSGMNPKPGEFNANSMAAQAVEGDNYSFLFPYAPIDSWAAAEGYSILSTWNLLTDGVSVKSGTGSATSYGGWVVGKNYLLIATLNLLHDGSAVPNVKKEFTFEISVSPTDEKPVITKQSPSVVDYTDGQDVGIYCIATGLSLKYTWYRYAEKTSRFGDRNFVWSPVYNPNGGTLTVSSPGPQDNGVSYKCVVSNSAGKVESKIFTLRRVDCEISLLTLTAEQPVVNGKAVSVSVYGADKGVLPVNGQLFVADDKTAAAAAKDYPTFISSVTGKSEGDAVPAGAVCYLGFSASTDGGYTFSKDLSVLVNMEQARILSLDDTSAFFVVKVDTFLKGDVNGDGKVNSTDYMMVKRHVLKTTSLSDDRLTRADLTGDGKVMAQDYLILKRIVLGTYAG